MDPISGNRMKGNGEKREIWSESWSKSLNIIILVPLYLWVVSSSEITREMYPGSEERGEKERTMIIIISSTSAFGWIHFLSSHLLLPFISWHEPPPNPVFYFLLLFFFAPFPLWRCNNPLPLIILNVVAKQLARCASQTCNLFIYLHYVSLSSLNRVNFECLTHQLTRWLCFDRNVTELTRIMTRSSILSINLESVAWKG